MDNSIKAQGFVDRADPEIRMLPRNSYFAIWNKTAYITVANSAWDRDGNWVAAGDKGKIAPLRNVSDTDEDVVLEGDWVGYTAFFEGVYGHFSHDWFPTLAYLRANMDPNVKFILLDRDNTKKELEFIDKDFFQQRCFFVTEDQIVKVTGNLSVVVFDHIPYRMNFKLLNYARAWIEEKHPRTEKPRLVHPRATQRSVVLYSRGFSSDVNGRDRRALDLELEERVIAIIEEKMKKYKPSEKFVFFTGQKDNKTMNMGEQFETFRSASTIIGPHGTGKLIFLL